MIDNRVDEIEELYAKAEAQVANWDLDQAEETLGEVLELEPEHARATNKLGVVFARRKEFGRAEELFARALELDPTLAGAYSNLGNIYQQKGMNAQASACYEKAIAFDPEHATAHHNLGVLLKKEGKIGDGIYHLKEATRLEKTKLKSELSRSPAKKKTISLAWLVLAAIILFYLIRRM